MATIFIENKLYPEDFNKNVGTLGITLPMNGVNNTELSSFFNMSKTTEEQVISNYINLLLTRKGERFMQPEFGVGLMYYVFEQNTDFLNTFLRDEILMQSALWLPYIQVNDIRVSRSLDGIQDDHTVNIQIQFKVFETGANRTITIFTPSEQQFNILVE